MNSIEQKTDRHMIYAQCKQVSCVAADDDVDDDDDGVNGKASQATRWLSCFKWLSEMVKWPKSVSFLLLVLLSTS